MSWRALFRCLGSDGKEMEENRRRGGDLNTGNREKTEKAAV